MTEIANVYGGSLYELAKDESLSKQLLDELAVLGEAFAQEPAFLRLLSSASLAKSERCQIIEDSFRSNFHPYVLNFLKILTEKGYMRHFGDCCEAYRALYNRDNGILPVNAITAVALSDSQRQRLSEKLAAITGKKIELNNRIDPNCLGGIRLDYDGNRLDDTVEHRLNAIRSVLKNTVL